MNIHRKIRLVINTTSIALILTAMVFTVIKTENELRHLKSLNKKMETIK